MIWGQLAPQVSINPYLWIVFALAFLDFIPALYNIWFRVEEKSVPFIISQVINVFLLILFVIVFMVYLKKGLSGALTALILNNAILWLLFAGLFLFKIKKISFHKEFISKTLEVALPIFFGYVAYFIVNKFSVIILQRYVDMETIAVFSFAQQVAMIVVMIFTAIVKAAQPMIYSAKKSDLPDISTKISFQYRIALVVACALLILFLREIIMVLAPENYISSIFVCYALICANLVYIFTYVEGSILIYYYKPNDNLKALLVGAGLNIILTILLVPLWGIYGAAFALLISSGVFSLLTFYFSRNYCKYYQNKFALLLFLVIISAIIFTSIIAGQYFQNVSLFIRVLGALGIIATWLLTAKKDLLPTLKSAMSC
jgi:O-antigen/teichoic acid export membrane protein